MFSYLTPVLGDFGDIVFAPLYALSIFVIYKRNRLIAYIGSGFGFVEVMLSATDIMPSATFMWVYTYVLHKDKKTIHKYIDKMHSELSMLNFIS